MNERVTEDIVRQRIRAYDGSTHGSIRLWEQKSDDNQIARLLSRASKAGTGNPGFPEFLVQFQERPEFLIVYECKASIANHVSRIPPDSPSQYAVDGALHYARFLSAKYNVLAVAVSGMHTGHLSVSFYFHFKGESEFYEVENFSALDLEQLMNLYLQQSQTHNQDYTSLLTFSKELNVRLNKLKIKTRDRSLLIAAILTALGSPAFKSSYEEEGSANILLKRIKNIVEEKVGRGLKPKLKANLSPVYSFLDTSTLLSEGTNLISIIRDIDSALNAFVKTHQYYDFMGQFYIQFLKYSNSDKSLGIILTPPHLTDLAVGLADVGLGDVVLDNCAGTGGFLISAMRQMIDRAQENPLEITRIKQNGLVGVEIDPLIANLLCCNMFIHNDGRSNIILADAFSGDAWDEVMACEPSAGFLNPPFRKQGNIEEFEFVLNNLDSLRPGSKCVAVLPMQCAIAVKGDRLALKRQIMQRHTLDAVLSLPNSAFHQTAGTITCMMVFTAHRPHPKDGKAWLAHAKDDGFEVKKHIGRVDVDGRWGSIKEEWITLFRNREEKPGFSVMRVLQPEDEWCAEPYIRRPLSALRPERFQRTIRQFVSFLLANEKINVVKDEPVSHSEVRLDECNWRWFKVSNVLNVSLGPYVDKDLLNPGHMPYVTRTAQNNGVDAHGYYVGAEHDAYEGNCITIGAEGIVAYYQHEKFLKGNKINIVRHPRMNPMVGMFLVTVLDFVNVGIYNYGYAIVMKRLNAQMIPLPVSQDNGVGRESINWEFMERYIDQFLFSRTLHQLSVSLGIQAPS